MKQFNSQTVKLNAVNQFPWPDQESRIKAVSEVMTSFLQEYGLAWKDMAQELNDMVEKFSNGSLPEATSLQEVVSVWSWRMNLQVTVTIAGVSTAPLSAHWRGTLTLYRSFIFLQVIFKQKRPLKSKNTFRISHMRKRYVQADGVLIVNSGH